MLCWSFENISERDFKILCRILVEEDERKRKMLHFFAVKGHEKEKIHGKD